MTSVPTTSEPSEPTSHRPSTTRQGVTKALTIGSSALYRLILSQSGSFSKALTELISNSIDAGASSHYTLLKWNLTSLTALTQMAGRNEVKLSAAMRRGRSDLFALDTAEQHLPTP